MRLEIDDNPNTRGAPESVFRELEAARVLDGIFVDVDGRAAPCDIVSVEPGGRFGRARAVKITDSGSGVAYLIYGGDWGIRLRRRDGAKPWDLTEPSQWGEPYKIYGSAEDLLFAAETTGGR